MLFVVTKHYPLGCWLRAKYESLSLIEAKIRLTSVFTAVHILLSLDLFIAMYVFVRQTNSLELYKAKYVSIGSARDER